MTSADRIQVRLLGHPDLRREESRVTLATRNAVLLLGRLAVEGPQSRELLTSLLWPDADEQRGRVNLRRTLAYVRDGFGRDVEVVSATSRTLALLPHVDTDLNLVRRALEPPPVPARLTEATACWRGEFLEGMQTDGEELDAWLAQQRENWAERLALACEQLVIVRSRAGDSVGALNVVATWLARDPLAETAHRERIRLHLVRGDRPAALEAYQRCVDLLRRELGVEPSPATQELAARAQGSGHDAVPSEEPHQPRPEVPMVGRDREHSALTAAFERVAQGAAELVLVLGEPGVGKTRLVREFAAWAGAQAAELLEMRAFPSDRRLAYQAISAAIGATLAPSAQAWGEGADLRLFQAAAEHLDRLAARRPLVLIVDDLQWVDPDSIELLLFASAALARDDRRVLLVVTVRDDELAGSTALRDWVARAARELRLVEVPLHPLSPGEAGRLVELWPEPIGESARRLVDLSGGRPLLLVESLRYLAAGGDPDTIAPSIRESMLARLRSLPADARRLADAAAVLEKPTSMSALAMVASLDPRAAPDVLADLLDRHILAGEGLYSFSHELLRQSAYAALPLEVRRGLHNRAIPVLDGAPESSPAEVARHAELAGNLELAWERRLGAANEAMALPAYRAAADHFRAAIAIRTEAGEAWLGLGRAEELSGRSDLAAETYRMLAQRARDAGRPADEAAALVRLAELAGRDLAAAPPVDLFEDAADAAAEAGDPGLRLEADLAEAQVLAYRGELRRAGSAVESAHRRSKRAARPDLVARCLNLGAFVSQAEGRWADALALSRRAEAAYRELGDRLMWLDSTGYEVAALVFLGRWPEALRRVGRALGEANRLDNPWAVCNLSLVEAWALRDGGRLEGALGSAQRGVEKAIQAGFAPLQVLNGAIAGRCRRELGDLAGAISGHLDMLTIAQDLTGVARQCIAEELTADYVAVGDWESAASWADASIRTWGEMRMFAYLSLWTVAEARLRSGADFSLPSLPAGDRYELVGLRTRAVVARHAGASDEAAEYMRQALSLAERLELAIEIDQLREVMRV